MYDLPTMNPPARAAFARLTHATAHEMMALRALRARMQRDGVTTTAGVLALVNEMLVERMHSLGLAPDEVDDAFEGATLAQRMDMELVRGSVGHA